MTVLAFDTATPSTVVGVLRPDGRVTERRDDPVAGGRPQHTGRLLELARAALQEAELALGDVTRIGVGVGPGGFTGLRIGVATARGLAQALEVPLVGVSSLQALAAGAGARPVLAVLDARRGEAFVAGYDDGVEVLAAQVARPEDLPALAGLQRAAVRLAVGDGALRFSEELERGGATVPAPDDPAHRIAAGAVCGLVARAPDLGRDAVVPAYLRVPDAELTRRARTP